MFGDFGAIMKLLGNREKLAAAVAATVAEGVAGGGLVKVTVGGDLVVRRVELAESALAMPDLAEAIRAATNEAITSAKKQLAANLGLPASLLASFPGLG